MKDKLEGKFDEIKGEVTGDQSEELKGKGQQKVGDVKEGIDDLKDRTEDSDSA
jgi:uncharacterized protein YjbJ (UPF0337 family)